MEISRIIAGGFMTLIGVFLIIFSFFESFFLLIYGIPLFVIGAVILFNKREDEIEERVDFQKSMKGGRK